MNFWHCNTNVEKKEKPNGKGMIKGDDLREGINPNFKPVSRCEAE